MRAAFGYNAAQAMTTVYTFDEEGFAPIIYPFNVPVPVHIYSGQLAVGVGELAS